MKEPTPCQQAEAGRIVDLLLVILWLSNTIEAIKLEADTQGVYKHKLKQNLNRQSDKLAEWVKLCYSLFAESDTEKIESVYVSEVSRLDTEFSECIFLSELDKLMNLQTDLYDVVLELKSKIHEPKYKFLAKLINSIRGNTIGIPFERTTFTRVVIDRLLKERKENYNE